MQNKIVFIVGPTGIGKTDLAFDIAKIFNGELISADSIQVYSGLDIVSGKDLSKTAKFFSLPQNQKYGYNTGFYIDRGVPIFLLDVVESTVAFSVSNFQALATDAVEYIFNKDKLPIVVGGTGLYAKSLIEGIDTASVKPDLKLRKRLENLDVLEVQKKLKHLNIQKFESMNVSDKNNKRRLIRAIEVSKNGLVIGKLRSENQVKKQFDSLVIGLLAPREILKKRIDQRVELRLQNGALEEATKLFENYEKLAAQIKDANGYKHLFQYLKKEISREEAIYRWKISEYHHAKNQMTWFRKYCAVEWFDIGERDVRASVEKRISKFLQ